MEQDKKVTIPKLVSIYGLSAVWRRIKHKGGNGRDNSDQTKRKRKNVGDPTFDK